MLDKSAAARSAVDYDSLKAELHRSFDVVDPPPDLLTRALTLQRDLAHHRKMWHRTAIFHHLGVVHVGGDYERIAEVRPLVPRRLG